MDIENFATAFEKHLHDRRGQLSPDEELAKQRLTCFDPATPVPDSAYL